MNSELSADQWVSLRQAQAQIDFRDHKLSVVGPGHWRIYRPDSSAFWTQIVAMGPGLAVWGDIDACVFAFHSGKPEVLVSWIAGSEGSYLLEKARIGMGYPMVDFVPEVAVYELRQRLKDAEEEFDEDWEKRRIIGLPHPWAPQDGSFSPKEVMTEAVSEAIDAAQRGEPAEVVHRELYEGVSKVDQDAWEWVGDIGMVMSSRVIYAAAAVRKLHELLSPV